MRTDYPQLEKVFVIAMPCEAQAVIQNMTDTRTETICGRAVTFGRMPCASGLTPPQETAVLVSGIGKTNTAATAQLAMLLFQPKEVLNFGVAGALLPSMRVGEIYEVSRCVQYDFDLTCVNGTQMGTLNEYESPYFECGVTGKFPLAGLGSGDRFNDSQVDYHLLKDELKLTLRDMEGAALAHVARYMKVGCRLLKAVSDVAGSEATPDQYKNNLARVLKEASHQIPLFFESKTQPIL